MRGTAVLVILLLLLLCTAGCATADYRKGPAICAVHGVPLETRRVPLSYGLPMYAPPVGYHKAKSAEFPNSTASIDAGCGVRSQKEALVWWCAQCDRARAAWLDAHDGNKHPFSE